MRKSIIVKQVLEQYPVTADNDMLLILAVWHKQGIVIPAEVREMILSKGLSPETITRIRRKLRETGNIKGSTVVEAKRYNKFVKIHGNSSLENIEATL